MLQTDWSILIVTLPTRPAAVRLRAWRALKALGAAALRDGAWLLPVAQAALFDPVAADVQAHGGSALCLGLAARDEAQQQALARLFDRGEAYAQWRAEVDALRQALATLPEADARRQARVLAERLQAIVRTDHAAALRGDGSAQQAVATLQALQAALDARFQAGEPTPTAAAIARLPLRRYQGRRWATRARPKVDRLASAWLIRRFIDPAAQFVWLADVGTGAAPRGVVGFDYDGAAFSHVGARVTFEVLAASFGLDADPRLQRIGALVHVLDVGGIPVPEAAGLDAVLSGLRTLHADDDALLAAAAAVFDALYATPAGAA